MAAVFQLARVRRTSASCASSPRLVEIPEATKTLLESLTDPLLVVTYFSCSRAVQNALWSTFRHTYRAGACGGKPTDFNGGSSNLTGGIWAFLPSAGSGPGTGSGTITDANGTSVQVLYLIYRDDYAHNDSYSEQSSPNVVSVTTADTEMDVKRLSQPLEILASTPRHGRERISNLASLGWRWFGSREMTTSEQSSFGARASTRHLESGFETLERIIQQGRVMAGGVGQDGSRTEEAVQTPVANLRELFSSVECHRPWTSPPSLSSLSGRHTAPESANVPTHLHSDQYEIERVLTQDLRDLTRIDKHVNVHNILESHYSGRGSLGVESSWFKEATSLEDILGDLGSVSDNPRIANGTSSFRLR
ncbi:hypothetical protein BGZ68_010222 [Mortierella alpina]|nr:hypothetical protein BGZ68_010222 [Mortierella alpina]